jgi:alpha-beta hydrolase superfamily lysophospholipase
MIRKIIKWLLLFFVVLFMVLYFLQEKLIFHPEDLPKDYTYNFSQKFEEVNLESKDKITLNTLHFKVENSKGVIIYFHGNKGNLKRWGEIASYFTQFNYDVFVIDYRGYGKSTGKFNEKAMYGDAQLCYEYVKQQYSEKDIVVYGRSLGTTFAAYIASQNKPKQLILEAAFFNLIDAAKHQYIYVPKFLLKYKFNTNEYIKNVSCPIVFFHGTDDWITPYEGSKRLFKEATSNDKHFITIENGSHNNLMEYQLYKEKVKKFLN